MCFFLFPLIIDLYFLILAIITEIFNCILELIIPLEISTKESKEKTVIPKTKLRECSM